MKYFYLLIFVSVLISCDRWDDKLVICNLEKSDSLVVIVNVISGNPEDQKPIINPFTHKVDLYDKYSVYDKVGFNECKHLKTFGSWEGFIEGEDKSNKLLLEIYNRNVFFNSYKTNRIIPLQEKYVYSVAQLDSLNWIVKIGKPRP